MNQIRIQIEGFPFQEEGRPQPRNSLLEKVQEIFSLFNTQSYAQAIGLPIVFLSVGALTTFLAEETEEKAIGIFGIGVGIGWLSGSVQMASVALSALSEIKEKISQEEGRVDLA